MKRLLVRKTYPTLYFQVLLIAWVQCYKSFTIATLFGFGVGGVVGDAGVCSACRGVCGDAPAGFYCSCFSILISMALALQLWEVPPCASLFFTRVDRWHALFRNALTLPEQCLIPGMQLLPGVRVIAVVVRA